MILDCNDRFLPESCLNALFNESAVKATLNQPTLNLRNDVTDLARFVCNDAKKLFAALVWQEVEDLIDDFFDMNFGDDKLPVSCDFKNQQFSFGPTGRSLKTHPFTKGYWKRRHLDDFCHGYQWLFQSPVFEEHKFRYSFAKQIRLPFVDPEAISERPSGFSVVKEYHIHRDHLRMGILAVSLFHQFPTTYCVNYPLSFPYQTNTIQPPPDSHNHELHPRVAIKELRKMSMTDDAFETMARTEADTLEMLRRLNHDHLIKAIAYYTIESKHFVMFPWADYGNLRDFWKNNPPRLDYNCLRWAFTQLLGLADAIKALHHQEKKRHWRHGDLKPENILCFKGTESRPGTCTMVIADVGLSKDHVLATEKRFDPTGTTCGTLMYEAPGWYKS